MREILFRGQTRKYGEKVRMGDGQKLPGHWVYGGVLQGVGSHSIIYGGENVNDPGENLDKWCVHTDTLGQFTGLTDKNGKKIFEGDIIKSDNGNQSAVSVVCYGEFSPLMFYDLLENFVMPRPKEKLVGLFLRSTKNGEEMFLSNCSKLIEVIGNIHDNPDLLDEK